MAFPSFRLFPAILLESALPIFSSSAEFPIFSLFESSDSTISLMESSKSSIFSLMESSETVVSISSSFELESSDSKLLSKFTLS